MIFAGSPSRLRLYTKFSHYLQVLGEILFFRWRQDERVAVLERQLSESLYKRHCILVPMARVGVHLAIKHTIDPGQKVIMSPYTIADVVNMVVSAGGVPVFADIERQTCNISLNSVRGHLNRHEPGQIGCVLVTHFYGLACDVESIREECIAHQIPVIEDAAQSFGLRLQDGRFAGCVGDAGVFSFGMFKNVTSFYGGAVVTDNEDLAQAIRKEINEWPLISRSFLISKVISGMVTDLITWPPLFRFLTFRLFRYGLLNDVDWINDKLKIDRDPVLQEKLPGSYRHRISGLQAHLIQTQLPEVDRLNGIRQAKADIYYEGLNDIAGLILPPRHTDCPHLYGYYTVQCESAMELVKYAMRNGRDITLSYHRNCATIPSFHEFHSDCPNAQATSKSLIYLPCYPAYSDNDVRRNIKVIKRYFDEGGT